MGKKILYSLTILSMTFLLVSCGVLNKTQTSGISDQGTTQTENVDEEAVAAEEVQAWDQVWEQALSHGEKAESAAQAKSDNNDILFDYDKYNIREDARPSLNAAGSYLNRNTDVNIVIEGHGDERGTNEYNLALGEKRAKATKNYLRALGIAPARMNTVTYGEEKPVCTEPVESCWQRNRRSAIKLSDLD